MAPLMGCWATDAVDTSNRPLRCTRSFRALGKGWIELDASWNLAGDRTYGEIALFGAMPDGELGFYSFTSDGKRSEGRLCDGSDIHPSALCFEAKMPAGLARAIYWPDEGAGGFYFAVESKSKQGWSRFLCHHYRLDRQDLDQASTLPG